MGFASIQQILGVYTEGGLTKKLKLRLIFNIAITFFNITGSIPKQSYVISCP